MAKRHHRSARNFPQIRNTNDLFHQRGSLVHILRPPNNFEFESGGRCSGKEDRQRGSNSYTHIPSGFERNSAIVSNMKPHRNSSKGRNIPEGVLTQYIHGNIYRGHTYAGTQTRTVGRAKTDAPRHVWAHTDTREISRVDSILPTVRSYVATCIIHQTTRGRYRGWVYGRPGTRVTCESQASLWLFLSDLGAVGGREAMRCLLLGKGKKSRGEVKVEGEGYPVEIVELREIRRHYSSPIWSDRFPLDSFPFCKAH
ncbi:hypothetical protein KM043_011670 [Ampulex compressa]|nr:hypothetical protein KM043_011670 [Ampulex compressa]